MFVSQGCDTHRRVSPLACLHRPDETLFILLWRNTDGDSALSQILSCAFTPWQSEGKVTLMKMRIRTPGLMGGEILYMISCQANCINTIKQNTRTMAGK